MTTKPIKVAVIGGGCASMTAAWELSHPKQNGKFEVTVYQEGWRLGGKGASGRGASHRIEEHGLHVWLGFYDNAFRLMRECYAELAASGDHRFGDWREAWIPESDVGLMSPNARGGWEHWTGHFAPRPGLPGDPIKPGEFLDLRGYLVKAIDLITTMLVDVRVTQRDADGTVVCVSDLHTAPKSWKDALNLAVFAGRAGLAQTFAALASTIANAPAALDTGVVQEVESLCGKLREQLEARWLAEDPNQHIWVLADLALATVLGIFRDGVLWSPHGLDVLEDYEARAWLLAHGASERGVRAPYIRGLYDLSMGYEGGDPERPNLSAGQGLRGVLRTFFGYRGALMWRMRSAMGDVVFAPLYEALRRRGVAFEFFHRLTHVGLEGAGQILPGSGASVASLAFEVQARIKGGQPYRPLIEVAGRPCWPAEPEWDQLAGGAAMKRDERDFENFWDRRCDGEPITLTLRQGDDFDAVVLGVGLGVIPYVCSEFLDRDPRWLRMTQEVKTVASQAFQLWLTKDLAQLGWAGPPYLTGAFAKPFDTWCDMAHVAPEEAWAERPLTSVYFCGVLEDDEGPRSADDRDYPKRRKAKVKANALAFLQWPMPACWPDAFDDRDEFRWELLAGGEGADRRRFDSQYWRANVNPSDRYTIHTPGSFRYRLSPLDDTYKNLTIAGDWTASGFDSGCVEGAVMSGLLAAHSLSGEPKLEDVIAYDHP